MAAVGNYEGLNEIVQNLSNKEMSYISRYFSILPLLINISEDVDLAFEINYQNNVGQDYLGKLSTTIDLVAEKENAAEILEHLNVVPVFNSSPNSSATDDYVGFNQSHSCLVT